MQGDVGPTGLPSTNEMPPKRAKPLHVQRHF